MISIEHEKKVIITLNERTNSAIKICYCDFFPIHIVLIYSQFTEKREKHNIILQDCLKGWWFKLFLILAGHGAHIQYISAKYNEQQFKNERLNRHKKYLKYAFWMQIRHIVCWILLSDQEKAVKHCTVFFLNLFSYFISFKRGWITQTIRFKRNTNYGLQTDNMT